MEALKFVIKGKLAHFKNPENNIHTEFTFNNIHKPAILGLLGAVIGLNGRNQYKDLGYLEYYEKLKDLGIAIIPHKACWNKFVDTINNSTGFGNAGSTQIIRREFLENVSWTIYIIQNSTDNLIWETLKNNLLDGRSVYPIGLGSKKNAAMIEYVEVNTIFKIEKAINCSSLIPAKYVNEIKEEKSLDNFEYQFVLNESLPNELNTLGLYKKQNIIFTSNALDINRPLYCVNKQNICFL